MLEHFRNHLSSRRTLRFLSRAARSHATGLLLDLGSGGKPYAGLFSQRVAKHVGADRTDSLHGFFGGLTDCAADLRQLPFRSHCAGTVLCTAVLEHCEEPLRALAEMRRCLSPGGKLILTAPFIWHIHEEPRDFFRYSRYGLEYLLRKAGFEIVSVEPLSGFFGTFAQLGAYQLFRLHRGPLRALPVIPCAALALQVVGGFLDRFDQSGRWPWAYGVVAQCPEGGTGPDAP